MRHNKTKELLNYWMDLYELMGNDEKSTGPRIWPERSDVRPSECRTLLSDMFILETENHEAKFRLAGTSLCSIFGKELKGQSFASTFEPKDQRAAENWALQMGTEEFVAVICTQGMTAQGEVVNFESLLLPLSHQGMRGTRALGITVASETPVWLGYTPIVHHSIRSVRVLHPWAGLQERQPTKINRPVEKAPRFNRAMLQAAPALAPTQPEDFTPVIARDTGLGKIRKFGHLGVIDGGRAGE